MSATVVGLTVAAAAIPANAAVFIPPPAAATMVSANPADNTPHAQNGTMRAFAQVGNTIYAGGSFTGIKNNGQGTWTSRSNLIAYDATTGLVNMTFNPILDGQVSAIAVNAAGKLIVGGSFGTVNGVARKGLVALEPSNGATVAGFTGRADGGVVRRVIVKDDLLYIAGAFHYVNGTAHSLLARLNATTGAIDTTFNINASVARTSSELVWALALSPDGRTLIATGNFTVVNTLTRNQVVMIDVSATPTVTNWSTERYVPSCSTTFPFYARDVDFSDDGSYFAIAADGGKLTGAYCDTVTRWETSSRGDNIDATWVQYSGHDSVTAVEAVGNIVYAGGHFRWMNNANGNDAAGPGAVDRYGLAALNPSNGMPMNWNPGRSAGGNLPPGGTNWGAIVWEIWKGAAGVLVGQDSDGLGNEYHGRQALFPSATGRNIPIVDAPKNASGYLYLGGVDGHLYKHAFNGTTIGAQVDTAQPSVTAAGASFSLGTKVFWAKTDAAAPSGSTLQVANMSSSGVVGTAWLANGYNKWFAAAAMNGAFYLNGRMYFITASSPTLQYRYFEPDGNGIVGDTVYSLPTTGISWNQVRGMAWVDGKMVFGKADGSLASVPFDPTAANGFALDASQGKVLVSATAEKKWSKPTLLFYPN